MVFGLKCVDAKSALDLTLSEIEFWLEQAEAAGALKRR